MNILLGVFLSYSAAVPFPSSSFPNEIFFFIFMGNQAVKIEDLRREHLDAKKAASQAKEQEEYQRNLANTLQAFFQERLEIDVDLLYRFSKRPWGKMDCGDGVTLYNLPRDALFPIWYDAPLHGHTRVYVHKKHLLTLKTNQYDTKARLMFPDLCTASLLCLDKEKERIALAVVRTLGRQAVASKPFQPEALPESLRTAEDDAHGSRQTREYAD
jgi:hypothetical protein